LIVAILCLIAGLLSVWVTLLQGFTVNTATGIALLVVSMVLGRRWWQSAK